jgi:Domain of unknown function (DUF1707)
MCHHHHRHRHEHRARDVERPQAPAGPIRVADADRERVVELLRGHAAAGRLDTPELEERLERAYAARYGLDLDAVLAELPPEPAPRARPQRRATVPAPLLPIAAIGALIALAAITGAWWLMWLIWPILVVLGPRRHYRRARY